MQRYNSSISTTYKPDLADYGSDDVMDGSWSLDNICVEEACTFGQRFVEATSLKAQTANDGIFGIRWPIVTAAGKSFMQTLFEQKKIARQAVALWQNRTSTDTNTKELSLGGYDMIRFSGNITWLEVTGRTFFEIRMQNVEANNVSIGCDGGCRAVLIPGAELAGPFLMVESFHNIIGFTCEYMMMCYIPCENVSNLPEIVFVLNGTRFPITGRDYVSKYRIRGKSMCISRLKVVQPSEKHWVLGESFIERYYTVIDFDRSMIGFAENSL